MSNHNTLSEASRTFPQLYKVRNVGNKGLYKEEQNKFSKNSYLQWGLNLGPYDSETFRVSLSCLPDWAAYAVMLYWF